ncbi:hypothetical protein A3Q34_07010 [Colwellia sp. PAMC 20917]|nr:hypothetical protein A3Q34_07010 [Colwellia sp. PAMC 20917]
MLLKRTTISAVLGAMLASTRVLVETITFVDLKNTGSGGLGATTAASFLQHFVGDVRWAHLDIAGNALSSKAKDKVPTGGTGFGVRLLSEWLMTKEK